MVSFEHANQKLTTVGWVRKLFIKVRLFGLITFIETFILGFEHGFINLSVNVILDNYLKLFIGFIEF